ncbi:hypothetical protein JTB14_002842 [Gonioctena quinquepunctata]|nr:hypothetical protein JTB14_002842 [Gonioctena quinquepunctata]
MQRKSRKDSKAMVKGRCFLSEHVTIPARTAAICHIVARSISKIENEIELMIMLERDIVIQRNQVLALGSGADTETVTQESGQRKRLKIVNVQDELQIMMQLNLLAPQTG